MHATFRAFAAMEMLAFATEHIRRSTIPFSTWTSTVPACKETQQGCPEGAAGEAVDDEVDARVQHEKEVVDTGKWKERRSFYIHSDLQSQGTKRDEENGTKSLNSPITPNSNTKRISQSHNCLYFDCQPISVECRSRFDLIG